MPGQGSKYFTVLNFAIRVEAVCWQVLDKILRSSIYAIQYHSIDVSFYEERHIVPEGREAAESFSKNQKCIPLPFDDDLSNEG